MWGSDQTWSSARLLIAAAFACALLLATTLPSAARGGAAPAEARDASQPVPSPRQPIGSAETTRGDLRLSRTKLLSGRPGQRLEVRYRLVTRSGGGERFSVVLRRVRRADPRHPGQRLGGETERRATARSRGRLLKTTLDGLNPQPGPHRVIIKRAGEGASGRLASGRIMVLPQGRIAQQTREQSRVEHDPAPPPDRGRRRLAAGGVQHDLSFRPGSEAASAIALELDNADRGIAVSGNAGADPLAFISSAGFASGSVHERRLPTSTKLPGGGRTTSDICCDAAVASDSAGHLWMAAATGGGTGRIVVNRVAPETSAFAGASTGLPVNGSSTDQQKPALAVVDGDAIAAVWVETAGGAQNVVHSGCDISGSPADCDDPDNWSAPAPLTSGSGLYSLPAAAFSPDGDLYVAWWDAGADNAVEINRCQGAAPESEDCSLSGAWDEEATIADLDGFDDDGIGGPDPLPLFCPIIAAPGGLVGPSPSVAVGPAGQVYVSYSDLRDNADAGSPSRCTASGTDKTFDSYVAAAATPDTIPTANTGLRVSADGALDVNDHFLPSLSVDPSSGEVEVTTFSTEDDPGGQRVRRLYTASSDLGLTYSAPAKVDKGASRMAGPLSDGIDYGDRQGGAAAGGSFRPVWTDAGAAQSRDPDLYVLGNQVETTIDPGSPRTIAENSGSLAFSTNAVRAECAVLGITALATCSSPFVFGPLVNGSYTALVRATDLAGNLMDTTPPTAAFSVADLRPPETMLTQTPRRKMRRKRPKFTFESSELNSKFECSYDKRPWRNCRSPKRAKVTPGKHRFRVRAKDFTGNLDSSAAKFRFTRKRKR